jgi:aldose 1-epimerase
VELGYRGPTGSRERSVGPLGARIAAGAGANLFSFAVNGSEFLAQPSVLAELVESPAGTPILFPTPNRVRGGRMAFEGRRFFFPPNLDGHFIHGLARHCVFQVGQTKVSREGASVELFLDWNRTQRLFSQFPIEHRLAVTYSLRRDGIRIAFAVTNRDQSRLPFGFGLHPWFQVPGRRDDVRVELPVRSSMQAEDLLPTGDSLSVVGTGRDLRRPTSLAQLNLDDVYLGLTPETVPAFERRDLGLRLTLAGSREFSHMVVYTPRGKPYFCMENQTCSTDAHNLHERGHSKVAHLLVARGGQTVRGWVSWRVRRLGVSSVARSASSRGVPSRRRQN